jgi:hypothetical protein
MESASSISTLDRLNVYENLGNARISVQDRALHLVRDSISVFQVPSGCFVEPRSDREELGASLTHGHGLSRLHACLDGARRRAQAVIGRQFERA